jgi:hypothetical protein
MQSDLRDYAEEKAGLFQLLNDFWLSRQTAARPNIVSAEFADQSWV